MHYEQIENCHVENEVLGKDFNLGATTFYFMFSPPTIFFKGIQIPYPHASY
jgi:hypothetical protein